VVSFDSTFKALIDIDPLGWARFVSNLAIIDAHSVDTSLHETQRVVDRLMNVGLGTERFLIHIEFQAGHDGFQMPGRLLRYNADILLRHRIPALSCVILLNTEADSPVLSGVFAETLPVLGQYVQFDYRVCRLWEEPLERFLIPESSLVAAGVLSRFTDYHIGEVRQLISTCIDTIQDEETREKVRSSGAFLAGLRFNENQAGYIVGRDLPLLEQSSVAQYFLRRGHEKGLDEGQVKLFITGAERVYGPVPVDLRPRIEHAPFDHLVKWMSNMRTASSWSELISD
jgi:hypothetical protein